ncbi:hypothetical protein [Streptomyces violaceusniger]|uniref:hypothetical protein n=1 Tax=Streptomyces violaceusniger TaxID=68280 RepID=UPI003807A000
MGALTVLWLVVLGLGGALEVVALVAERRGTCLSDQVWTWFAGTDRRRAGWTHARRMALLVAMTWLAVRFNLSGRL